MLRATGKTISINIYNLLKYIYNLIIHLFFYAVNIIKIFIFDTSILSKSDAIRHFFKSKPSFSKR